MKKIFFLFMSLCYFSSVSAQTIDEMVFFGDSLTDNGNLYSASFKLIPKSPPYYLGRFSNGPVWSDILSDFYQTKYQIQSSNYAVGGATVILRRPREGALPYFLSKEVQKYLKNSNHEQRSKTLYFLWMGGNDYMDEKKETPEALVNSVVNEMVTQIRTLITNGGKRFVIIDLPDFAKAPFAGKLDQATQDRLRLLSEMNHSKILEVVENLQKEYPNFKFIFIDVYNTFNDMFLNIEKYNLKYDTHISNIANACWTGGYTLAADKSTAHMQADLQMTALMDAVLHSRSLSAAYQVGQLQSLGVAACDNADDYLFWDTVHPTTAGHQILGQLIIEQLESLSAIE